MSVFSPPLLICMATALVGYWVLPERLRDAWLSGITLAFLLYCAPVSATILLTFACGTYYFTSFDRLPGRVALAVSAAIVAVLVYYKLRVSVQLTDSILAIAIPLGLSYYSFRCLHYVIERYKGTLPAHSFTDFAGYLLFLPTILAGPINRFAPFNRDMQRRRWDGPLFAEGLERVLYGYLKIAFLANLVVNQWSGDLIAGIDPAQSNLAAYLSMLQHGLNGYLQFSGYSDIAIGFSLLFGYRIMENFNWPFLQKNIADFWRSWHISLSSWCRDYVYMVILSFTRGPALAALGSMLVIALWHEISLRYIVWGIYNGLGIAVWQKFQDLKRRLPPIKSSGTRLAAHVASVVITFHFVMLGFVLVQEVSLADALAVYRAIFLG